MNKALLGLLLCSTACAPLAPQLRFTPELAPAEVTALDQVHQVAFARAVACLEGREPAVNIEELNWSIAPVPMISLRDEHGKAYMAEGFYKAETHTIWIAQPRAKAAWVNAHEALHAVLGTEGHPEHFFRRCNLMADQNP
jgi:hypothetical protein